MFVQVRRLKIQGSPRESQLSYTGGEQKRGFKDKEELRPGQCAGAVEKESSCRGESGLRPRPLQGGLCVLHACRASSP